MNIQGNHNLQLSFAGDFTYLSYHGKLPGTSVIAEIVNGQLYIDDKPISFGDFIHKVKKAIKQEPAKK